MICALPGDWHCDCVPPRLKHDCDESEPEAVDVLDCCAD